MKRIAIITGSARPNSVNSVVSNLVLKIIKKYPELKGEIIDINKINLPYFDAPAPPASPHFQTNHKEVETWRQKIKESDGIILVMPEYNHSMTAIQKNAIDWLYFEWKDKPVTVVTYGSNAGKFALETFDRVGNNVKMKIVEPFAQFKLGDKIGWDGAINDQQFVDQEISKSITALAKNIS